MLNKDRRPGETFMHRERLSTIVKVEVGVMWNQTRITFTNRTFPSGAAIVVDSYGTNMEPVK